MLTVYQNLISVEEIDLFKKDFLNRIQENNMIIKDDVYDPNRLKELYNLTPEECKVLEYRSEIKDGPLRDLLEEKVYQIIPNHIQFYAAYQRQFLPQLEHVDDINDSHDINWCFTGVIPLEENINNIHKTIVWDKSFKTTENMYEYLNNLDESTLDKTKRIDESYDIEHVLYGMSKLNYINLDGVYNYELGSMGLFTRTHIHCSSNWKKYNLCDYKDFIILHFG